MGVKTLRTILSSVTHNGKQARAKEMVTVSTWLQVECTKPVSFLSLPAHDDSGLAGCGRIPLHRSRVQFLPQVLQQE